MDESVFDYLQTHTEVERFFDSLPPQLQDVMTASREAEPHTKPYRQYIQLLMQ